MIENLRPKCYTDIKGIINHITPKTESLYNTIYLKRRK